MKGRRRHRPSWTHTLPDDWSNEPKVLLFRLDEAGERRYLGTIWAYAFSLGDVASQYGGGRYWFKAIQRGRVVRQGAFDIEGEPIG